MRVDLKQYKAALEAVLFAVAEPISTDRLAELLEIEPQVVERLCEHLRDEYAESSHGIQLLCLEGDWQFATKPVFGDYVKAALDRRRNVPLSSAALEVLAIIAYNQPVTRAFVEQIRGVDSSSAVNSLVVRDLVEEAGRLELPGRPIAYRTTANFLRCFGLQSLDELPDITAAAQAQEQLEQLTLTPADGQGEEP